MTRQVLKEFDKVVDRILYGIIFVIILVWGLQQRYAN